MLGEKEEREWVVQENENEISDCSEPPDIFQHQSTVYLRTRGQETVYETCACVIHTNLQLHY